MKYEVGMPSLGADMDQGKLMSWLIKVGDLVKKGQSIGVVETTKSTVEIESFHEGRVLELIAKEGDEIRVGKVIAYFEIPDDKAVTTIAPERIRISPAARELAEKYGVNIQQIKGTEKDGAIGIKDVEARMPSEAIKRASISPTIVHLREAIAKSMSRSKKEIPHYYLKTRIHLDPFMKWIDELNQTLPIEKRVMIPAALLRAIALALVNHPEMNGYYVNGSFQQKESVNLGVALSLKEGGVLVPAMMSAQTLGLQGFNGAFQDLIVRTRAGKLKNSELTEGTITVTNVGDLGTDEVFGVIFPPQVALVGLGRIHQDVIAQEGKVRSGFVIDITLSADHRVTDGLSGARFLASIEKYLVEPQLLEDGNESTANKVLPQRDFSGDRP